MEYAREEGQRLVKPSGSDFPGTPGWRGHDALLRANGYLPVSNPPEEQDGKRVVIDSYVRIQAGSTHVEPRQVMVDGRYVMQDTLVEDDTSYWRITAWHYEDLPLPPQPSVSSPVQYSKYKLKLACESRGLWEQVKAAIESAGKWESFLLIQVISSDNRELQDALPGIRQIFGDETVEAVLAESEI